MAAVTWAALLWAAVLVGTEPKPAWSCPLFASEHQRVGVNVSRVYGKAIEDYDVSALGAGWYLDYSAQLEPPAPGGLAFVQVLLGVGFDPVKRPVDLGWIERLVDANPGALWIVGNEPDRAELQDNLTPEAYAIFYHDVYTAIKERDAAAQVAVGGIVQPTPLRLRYLDQVLDAYRQRYLAALPADVWTVHNFILREGVATWGAGIPPGLEDYAAEGMLYELEDHGRLDLFQAQIVAFRRWMAERGYRHKPLWVTEYGILMPDFYGYPEEVVEAYMLDTFDWMRTAQDPALGYAADGDRLVQAWGWFSLNDKQYDPASGMGYNGNLFDHDSGNITSLGQAFVAYVTPLVDRFADPWVAGVWVREGSFVPSDEPLALTVVVEVANGGSAPASGFTLRIWSDQVGTGTLLGEVAVPDLAPTCRTRVRVSVPWHTRLGPGKHTLVAEVMGGGDRHVVNNIAWGSVVALLPGEVVHDAFLPMAPRVGP